MTAPPELQTYDCDGDPCGTFDQPKFVLLSDHTAAIAAAEARGLEQGLREAAKYMAGISKSFADTATLMSPGPKALFVQSADVCRMAHDAILALIPPPKEKPDD
jgi:3-dehydroquinate synthetase